jgi:hypothetical protein
MLPYWLLFALTSLPAAFVRGDIRERNTRWGAALLAIFITLMIGLRYDVGGDWLAYVDIFDEAQYIPFNELLLTRADAGYELLNKIVIWAGLDVWAVNLVCAALFTWGLFRFSFKLPNPWLAIAVAAPYLITVVAMGYTRQGVAIGLVMLGMAAVTERSFVRFAFWTLVAASFHKSAMIMLPVVALSYGQNRLLVIAAGAIFTVLGYYLFVANLIGLMAANYADYESQGAAVRLVMNAVPAVLFFMIRKRLPIDASERAMWRNMALLALASAILVFQVQSTTALDRLGLYLIPLQLFVFSWIPSIFSEKGEPDRKLAILIVAYSAVVLFVWLTYASHAQFWLPYRLYPFFGGG